VGALCVLAGSLSVPARPVAAASSPAGVPAPEVIDPTVAGSTYRPLVPERLLDTRDPGHTALGPNSTTQLTVTGTGGVPTTGVTAVVVNVTSTEATTDTHLTVWPTGATRPTASNLNVTALTTIANNVIATVGTNGTISIYNNNGTTHVIVDIQGWFGPDTTEPGPPVIEGTQVGWRFVPSQMLLAPGQTRLAQLVQTDLAGLPTGSALPPGVTFEMTGAAGTVSVAALGGTTVQITAGSGIDTAVVAAQIPNTGIKPTIAVTVARLQPGVIPIDDELVAFPEPNLPKDGNVADLVGPDTTLDGVGPFTWDEIEARTGLPDGMGGLDDDALAALDVWYPVVLRGPAPPTGSLIVGTGGSAIVGEVIEPPGLPTLERDGWSLVAVRLVGLQLIYLDLNYELTYDDLLALGAVPPLPEALPLPEYPDLPDLDGGASPGPSRVVHQRTESLAPAEDPPPPTGDETVAGPGQLVTGGGQQNSNDCLSQFAEKAAASAGLVSFSPAVTLNFTPILNAYVSIIDGTLHGLRFEIGASLALTVTAAVKFQLSLGFSTSCTLADLIEVEIAAPGPLSAFFSVIGEGKESLSFSLGVSGGPKFEIGATCTAGATVKAGFVYELATDQTTDLGTASITPPACTPVFKPDLNVSSDGVGLSATMTLGLPLSAPISVRAGGSVAGAIGRLFSWVSSKAAKLGKAKALSASYGPSLTATWENETNTMANQLAASTAGAAIGGTVTVDVEPLVWLLKKFGTAKPNFSLTLFSQSTPLFKTYQPLNPVAGRTTATVANDDTPLAPAIYVQEDDEFELLATLGAAGGGLNYVPQLTAAKLFHINTIGVADESHLFSMSVVPSTGAEAAFGTTTIKVSATITKAICDELRAEPMTFKLVADAPFTLAGFDLSLPAWGGSFKVQCVEGKIAWDPTEVKELSYYDPTTVKFTTSGPKDDTFTITELGSLINPLWLKVDPSSGDLVGAPDGEETKDVELSVRFPGSAAVCWEPRTAQLVATTEHRGSAIIKITEEDPCLVRWTQPTVTGPGTVTATLETRGSDSGVLSVGSVPDWITVDPSGPIVLTPTGGNIDEMQFTIEVEPRKRNCQIQLPRSAVLHITTQFRGTADLTIIDPKIDPYPDCGLRFTPKALTGTGSSQLTIRDDALGDGVAQWTIDPATLPEWLGALPTSGDVSTAAPATVGFAVLPTQYDPCVGRPVRVATVTATATFSSDYPEGSITSTRTAQIAITDPAVPPIDCPKTTGGAWGDPHLWSMDGVAFEGQIIGDYVYSRSPAGAPDPFELVVRTVPTGGSPGSVAPTSVQAIALTHAGHTVEVYGGPPIEVLVDGEVVNLPSGAPLAIAPGLSVVRSDASVRIDIPNLTVDTAGWLSGGRGLLNITVSAAIGSPMEGILGSPDGDSTNDFRGSDGTPYTVADVQANKVPEFFTFVTSWRITDPDLTPFTRPSNHFATPNPGFDQEILDTYGPLVAAALDGSAAICSGNLTDRQLYGLALELAIGTAASDLERYICAYAVAGFALADGEPTAGLQVTVDADGLHPCVTTSGIDGRYFCRMVVDLAEVRAAAGPLLPLDAQVTGRWPGLASVAASATATFATIAAIDAGPVVATADLAIDPDSVPRVAISGTMSRDGIPLAGVQQLVVTAFDAADNVVLQTTLPAIVDNDDGHYTAVRVLPPTATRLTVSTTVLAPVVEVFTAELTDLQLGLNAMPFDVVYTVPTVTVQGTITDGADPIAGSHTLHITPRTAGGALLPVTSVTVTPDPSTGAYSATILLGRTAASATASIVVAPFGETYTSALTPMADGTATITLDVVVQRPLLRVSGAIADEHGAPLTSSLMQITFRNSGGAVVAQSFLNVPTTPTATSYSVERYGPVGAVSATVSITAGASGESFTTGSVVLAPGLNETVLDAVLAPVRLTVSGIMSDGAGDPLPGPVPITVFFYGAGDVLLGWQPLLAAPDPADGLYSLTFTGHRDAVTALVRVTPAAGDNLEKNVTDLVRGDNATTFDVGFNPPALKLHGRMTGPDGNRLAEQVLVKFNVYRADGSSFSRNAVATLDAEGDYELTAVFPLIAVEVQARVEVGPTVDWFHTERIPLVAGTNVLPFDIDYRPPVLTVSGTMVSAPGVPLAAPFVTGPVPLGITSFDADGVLIGYTQPNVTPGAGGAYEVVRTLPRMTVRVEVRAFVTGQNFVDSLTGVTPGSTPTKVFDVAYHPARLNLQGTALVDGSPATSVQAEIRQYTSPTTSTLSYVTIPVAGDGTFSKADLLLGLDTIAAEVTLRPAGGSAHLQSLPTVVQGNVYSLTYTMDDISTRLELSGTFRMFGEAAASTTVYAYPYDAGGHQIGGGVWKGVAPAGVDGAYATSFTLPSETASVVLSVGLTSPTTWHTTYQSRSFDLTPGAANAEEWSVDTTLLRVTGTLVDAGTRVDIPGGDELTFEVSWPDGGGGTISGEHTSSYDPFDNSFAFEVILPSDVPAVTVRLTTVAPPQPALLVSGLAPGIVDRQWDIDLATFVGTSIVVSGAVTDGGTPLPYLGDPYGVSMEVVGYVYVDGDTPLVEAFRTTLHGGLTPDDSRFLLGTDLPEEVTLAKVTLDLGADDGWVRSWILTPGALNEFTFDVELGTTRLRYSGNTILDGCTGPLVFEREIWASTSPPAVGYDWDTGTWPGATLIGRFLIAPDTTAPYHHDLAVHLPADSVWIGTIYRDHNSGGEGSGSIPPDSFIGFEADETHHC
jgi:hypothetical protein